MHRSVVCFFGAVAKVIIHFYLLFQCQFEFCLSDQCLPPQICQSRIYRLYQFCQPKKVIIMMIQHLQELCDFLTLKMLPLALALI